MAKKILSKIIIFDLDGVLINSKQNMISSWSLVKKKFNIKKSFKEYFIHLGLPFQKILEKLNIVNNKKKIEYLYKKNSLKNINKIKLYPGVKKVLKFLHKKNYILGIVTSKDHERTNKILKNHKIFNFFTFISCPTKSIRGKPYPDQILKNISLFNIKKNNIFYVGDTQVDSTAANLAKIKFIFAKYGYGKVKTKIKINSFLEILKIV
jgi:phosphoglycolate phosphatase